MNVTHLLYNNYMFSAGVIISKVQFPYINMIRVRFITMYMKKIIHFGGGLRLSKKLNIQKVLSEFSKKKKLKIHDFSTFSIFSHMRALAV